MRSVAHLIPDGPEGRRVPVPIGGGVELARDGERRGVAGGFPHPVPVRRRLLSRSRCRRLLHLYSFAGADDVRTDGLVPTTVQISRRGAGTGWGSTRRLHSNSDRFPGGSLPLSPFGAVRVSAHAQWRAACPRVPDASGTFTAVTRSTAQ